MAQQDKFIDLNAYKTKKKIPFNVGIIIFGIIFFYLIVTIILYLTSPHITSYEVREGSILNDYEYTGLAIREEMIVESEGDGYINYYTSEGSKVSAASNVYTLSNEKMEHTEVSGDTAAVELSEGDLNQIVLKTQKFNETFQDEQFHNTYNLRTNIDSVMLGIQNQTRINELDSIIASGNSAGLRLCASPRDGIIIYSVDGLEGITKDTLTSDLLNKTDYQKTELLNNQKITAGSPAYKLVTSEKWSVAIEIDKEFSAELSEMNSVKVRFLKDDEYLWANVSVVSKDDHYYGILSFNNSMVRYAEERYLDLELILEDETGLKIPKTAKVEKEFFLVPEEYVTVGGNSKEAGVIRKKRNGSTEFVKATVYAQKDGKSYIASEELKKGDTLLCEDSNDTMALNEKGTLEGVYNINRGYAVFRQINILAESEEYYIVEENTSYGLTNYDRIALDGKGIKEDEVVFR